MTGSGLFSGQAASTGGPTWSPGMALVVIINPPIDAAFCNAQRTTLVQPRISALTKYLNMVVWATSAP